MQDSVNQAEQEALLGGPPAGTPAAAPGADARPYNFNEPPRHNKSQLRSLRMLHESFCAPLAKTLGKVSGLPCHVKFEALSPEKLAQSETMVYVSASNGAENFLFALARPAVWLLLERLLGGPGGDNPETRVHSDIEKRVLSQLLLKPVAAAYGEIWARIAPVTFALGKFENDIFSLPGFTSATETVAAVFSVKLGESSGQLKVILPFSFLKPLIPELDVTKILGAGIAPGTAAPGGEALLGIAVNLRVILGSIDLKLKDLNSLMPGDVLRLDARPDDEVIVEVEGQPRFAGKAGRVGKSLGIQVTKEIEHTNKRDGETNGNKK